MAKWNVGPKNGLWNGGRSIASNGYVLIRVGKDHHLADVRGYAYEHRIVAEAKLGRRLIDGEQIHHINGNKQDNRPENIEVTKSLAHHRLLHRKIGSTRRLPDQANEAVECACGCGIKFARYDRSGRVRRFVTGHNMTTKLEHPKGGDPAEWPDDLRVRQMPKG